MRYPTIVTLPLLLALAPAASAQLVTGRLLDDATREPIVEGRVTLLTADSAELTSVRTDTLGSFRFPIPEGGDYRLGADRLGYFGAVSPPLSIGSNDTLQVEFSLARDIVVVEPLIVTARTRRLTPAARRFYRRAEQGGFGSFITREDIEKWHPLRTTDLFHRIPGVQTTPIMGGSRVTIRGHCTPTVYVDGTRVNGYRSIDDLAQPLEIEGIEVYRSAYQAPVEFTGLRAGCAVILIWTRIE